MFGDRPSLGAWRKRLRARPEAPRRGLEEFAASRPRGRSKGRHTGSFLVDQRGAVAFETLIVYMFIGTGLLLPLADIAAAGFQFISAWEALRGFGQYVQYHTPPDVTNTTSWAAALPTSVAGYPINSVQVLCGNTGAGAACTSTNVGTLPIKYYSYSTTVTLAPLVLKSVLCTSGNTNPCAFTLPYSERFL